ncbi:MAG TPA: hypothetical protein VK501_26270 [Baekduia sp.]|nr:hypothetical protein [Baekduia sp.]
MATSSSRHAFRYEPALCSLAEGETLSPPRHGDEPSKRRNGLRVRLSVRRASARRRAGS